MIIQVCKVIGVKKVCACMPHSAVCNWHIIEVVCPRYYVKATAPFSNKDEITL